MSRRAGGSFASAASTLNLVEASYRANPIVVSDEMRRAWEARLAQLDAQQSDSMRDEDVSESLDLMLKTGALRRAERGEAAPMRYEMTFKYDADNDVRHHRRSQRRALFASLQPAARDDGQPDRRVRLRRQGRGDADRADVPRQRLGIRSRSSRRCAAPSWMPGAKLDGQSVYELLEGEKVTFTAAVPTVWQGLLSFLRENTFKPTTLKRVAIGGSAVPETVLRAFEEDYGVEVIHAWGMTE